MVWNPDQFRRWSGGIYLGIAVGMVAAGLTVFRDGLSPMVFAVYWLICMLFTMLALMIALLEVRAVGRRSRQQQSDLMREMLLNVERKRNELSQKTGSQTQGSESVKEQGNGTAGS